MTGRNIYEKLLREIAPNVFETAYANGERTVCNYGPSAYRLSDGRAIPPMGYVELLPTDK